MVRKSQVLAALGKVNDPELGISVVDLGLVYDVKVKGKAVEVVMTLTTIGCPLTAVIAKQVETEIKKLDPDVDLVSVKFVFDPPWNVDRMSSEARTLLGL